MTKEEKNKAFKECLERISEKFDRVDFRERLMLRMAFDAGADLAEPERFEKVKCCFNCKHSRTEYEHCKTDKHEKWEIKEND
jgi:hypothetical protein